jgi:predicted nucleotidyltransferase
MRTRNEIVAILSEHRQVLQERYRVEELALFGSYAQGEQSPMSDVDILVRVRRPMGLKFFELWDYLEEILDLKVDLLTPEALQQKPALWVRVQEDFVYV